MQIGDSRLRYRMQAQPLRFLAEKPRNKRFDHIGFDFFRETLTDDGRRNVAAAEAGNAGHLLIFLDQRFGLSIDVRDRNLNSDFALGAAAARAFLSSVFFCFSGAHNYLSSAAAADESGENCSAAISSTATLSVKTLEEQRQTAEGDLLPTKVTVNEWGAWHPSPLPLRPLLKLKLN